MVFIAFAHGWSKVVWGVWCGVVWTKEVPKTDVGFKEEL